MTTVLAPDERELAPDAADTDEVEPHGDGAGDGGTGEGGGGGGSQGGGAAAASVAAGRAEVDPLLTGLATVLASAGGAWMVAGIFRGDLPRLLAVAGAVIGAGMVTLSYRARRPALLQWLALPLALVVGAVVTLAGAKGHADLVNLISQALRSGGLSQPPVPFDPGWRFLLVVLMAILGAAAAGLAIGLSRPKLAILLPAPLILAAALVQPAAATFVSAVVAFILLAASFAVAYSVDLARDVSTSARFEVRRFARGAGVLALLVVALIILSQAGFLFPKSTHQQVIPPKRPQVPPPQPDRVLFTYTADRQLPIRLGVLDVYRDVAWLTPPFDSARLQTVAGAGVIVPGAKRGDVRPGEVPGLRPAPPDAGPPVHMSIEVKDLTGHVLPDIQNPAQVTHRGFALQYDPRTQALRLPSTQAASGFSYNVVTRPPPTAKELAGAGPVPASMSEYLHVPAPPPAVQDLLTKAPTDNAFDRLQFMRAAYYQKVVAAGAGKPVDVPPARVQAMLDGKEATPFEITAGEALVARWAGVPARIGYGYFGGDRQGSTDVYSIRPIHGATWLEAYFDGYGWIPILGTPPKAKASVSPDKKNQDQAVRPTDNLAVQVYVPIRLQTLQLLYVLVRYWGLRALPWLVVLALAVTFYPGGLKAIRRWRRRQWAHTRGPNARVAVAYTEFRDAMSDLNIGGLSDTPIQFLRAIEDDDEHRELAWLVTRAQWGDLVRDVRPDDVTAAEEMAASVTKRVRRASGGVARAIAMSSRASLREPFDAVMPNAWMRLRPAAAVRGWMGDAWAALRRPRPRHALPASIVVLVLLGAAVGIDRMARSGGGSRPAGAVAAGASLPARVNPDRIGLVDLHREPDAEGEVRKPGASSLVSAARIFSLHDGDSVEGSLQIEAFKPGVGGRKRQVREGVLRSLGNNRFQAGRLGSERIYRLVLADQTMLLWFPPDGTYMDLLVTRAAFTHPDEVMAGVIAYQRGRATAGPAGTTTAGGGPGGPPSVPSQPLDPRRVTAN